MNNEDDDYKPMTWNYRAVRLKDKNENKPYYGICEVFYEDGKITGYTKPVPVIASLNYDELKESFEMMGQAFDRPLLVELEGEKLEPYVRIL